MKKILVLNFFPAFFPPKSGGELRYYNVYLHLSKFYDVTLLSPTYNNHKQEVICHSNTFREYRVPKNNIHDKLHMSLDQENICAELSSLVCYLSAQQYNEYHNVYQKLYKDADIIIHESPYMLSYDMYFGLDDKIRIYNSYNFEYGLMSQLWKGVNASKYLEILYNAEQRLVKESNIVFAISQEEKERFIDVYGANTNKIYLAPNGIDVELFSKLHKDKKIRKREKAFFIGSAHPPNIEAVNLIIQEIAPKCDNIDFYIAGKCCDNITSDSKNIFLLGMIDENEKVKLFTESDIAINPMLSGAGTNLKTLEFLAAGLPLISTEVGVRGLNLLSDNQVIVANREDFAEKLKHMLNNSLKLKSIAQNGKKYVEDNFSWTSICNEMNHVISKVESTQEFTQEKPRILVLNDFDVLDPVAGGEVRIYNLLNRLAVNNDVVLVCLNNDNKVNLDRQKSRFTRISIPKTAEHLEEEVFVNSKSWISASDIITGYKIGENKYCLSVVENFASWCDLIILQHPYMVDSIKNCTGKKIIYESLNFEYKLKQDLLESHPLYKELIKHVERLERTAIEKSQLILSVSAEEKPELQKFYGKNLNIEIVPNGVNFVERQFDYIKLNKYLDNKPIIVFVGSGHTPNITAGRFIIESLASKFPELIFAIIGSVCEALKSKPVPENVLLFGKLSEEHKNFILYSSWLALNPIEDGAGSNLKLAEYFAFGLMTITTPFGMRGYNLEAGKHAIVTPLDQFDKAIQELLEGKYNVEEIAENAYRYAKRQLSWDVIAKHYENLIEALRNKKRLLVITYRYNNPPRGGAEVYLSNVLGPISIRGNYSVDIATTNVGDIENLYHFASKYTLDETLDEMNVTCRKFGIEPANYDELWKKSNYIYINFMKESVQIAREFTDRYKEPILMGGWHFPEVNSDKVSIWSSQESDIFIKGVTSISLKGVISRKINLQILIDNQLIRSETLKGEFEIHLDNIEGMVFTLLCQTFSVVDCDPRPLGVYINDIKYNVGNVEARINLFNDYKSYLKGQYLDEYVNCLINIANGRETQCEESFYECRGPISARMREWLENNVMNYDVILGHSVPFSTLIMAQQLGNKYGIPTVLLPHFHMEDSFYHWKMYYDAFSKASKVLVAPSISKKLFFDKICTNSELVPGGGVNLGEFTNIDSCEFNKIYNSEVPFILVLGRKTGGKNYRWVIEAIESLNKQGVLINLIIIGKDEDKEKINSPNILYLGEQSRKVVLGALKTCRFLVNMSESESFGIVILEAWLAGKTVIVNKNCAAFTELVEDGVNGLYATKDNLADKIQLLLQESTNIENMQNKGNEKAQNGYTWNSIAEKIEKIFDSILSNTLKEI